MAFLETLSRKAGQYSGPGLIKAMQLIARNFAKIEPGIVSDGNADHILATTDVRKTLLRTRGTAQTVTFPQNSDVAIPVGSEGEILATGAGALTLQAGAGATMTKKGSTSAVVIANGRIKWTKTATNTFFVTGDLTAV